MGNFEYYSELVVFLESALGREFVNRIKAKAEAHREKKAGMAVRCHDSVSYDTMKPDFLKESIYIKAFDEILADIDNLEAVKSLVKEERERAIRG